MVCPVFRSSFCSHNSNAFECNLGRTHPSLFHRAPLSAVQGPAWMETLGSRVGGQREVFDTVPGEFLSLLILIQSSQSTAIVTLLKGETLPLQRRLTGNPVSFLWPNGVFFFLFFSYLFSSCSLQVFVVVCFDRVYISYTGDPWTTLVRCGFFSIVNTMVLHYGQLVQSTDTEPQIGRNSI